MAPEIGREQVDIIDDTFQIGWVTPDGTQRYIAKRGLEDLMEFIRNSPVNERRITSIKNQSWQVE